MLRGGEGGRRGPRIDRMGGLVLAMIVGVLVPPLVASLLGSRDPLPRNCGTGQVSATRLDGAILYTTGADLWYSEGYPGQPRKLVDLAPRPARLSPGATPSPSAGGGAASAPSTPSAAPGSPPASPAAPAPVPQVVAADITDDRRLVAVLVRDPPDRPGSISLRMLSPLDPPGKAPVEGWYNLVDRQSQVLPQVRILSNNKVLVMAGVPRAVVSGPSPAVSPSPLPSPSPSPSPGPVPTPSLSSPPAGSPAASPAAIAVVVDPGLAPGGDVLDVAPLDYFLTIAHSGWADTRSYRVAPELPA
ncbi:MAG TPA: hypothetical protein VGR61_08340, partial [Candidatus Dormibacteraeota bacterium]|nr:hypothetical protein [Candidatus Dormibacteraeota bacterium]